MSLRHFRICGASKETAQDCELVVQAADPAAAELQAIELGVFVSSAEPLNPVEEFEIHQREQQDRRKEERQRRKEERTAVVSKAAPVAIVLGMPLLALTGFLWYCWSLYTAKPTDADTRRAIGNDGGGNWVDVGSGSEVRRSDIENQASRTGKSFEEAKHTYEDAAALKRAAEEAKRQHQ